MRLEILKALTEHPQPPEWVVQDFLPAGTMVALAGDPGVGKSWFAYWLSFHVACGLPFLGQPTIAGPVIYFDQENSLPDTQEYVRQVWHGLEKPPTEALVERLCIDHFSLSRDWRNQMVRTAKEYRPRLIVVDTVSPACSIMDENDNAEAARVIAALRAVREAAGPQCCLLALRHAKLHFDQGGDHPKRTMRGAKAWHGAVDQVLFHVRAGPGRAAGLRPTKIEPDKVRAWGLKQTLWLTPESHGLGVALCITI